MPIKPWSFTLDQADSTFLILSTMAGAVFLLGLLFLIGWMNILIDFAGRVIQGTIQRGFRVWETTLFWARWPAYLLIVSGLLALGIYASNRGWDWLTLLIALVMLTTGLSACMAFMLVSIERAEVTRGYKAVHNPVKGQELARYVVLYGDRLGAVMLLISEIGRAHV